MERPSRSTAAVTFRHLSDPERVYRVSNNDPWKVAPGDRLVHLQNCHQAMLFVAQWRPFVASLKQIQIDSLCEVYGSMYLDIPSRY